MPFLCWALPVVDLLLLAPDASFLVLLRLGLFKHGRAGGGSNEVLAPAPLSLLNHGTFKAWHSTPAESCIAQVCALAALAALAARAGSRSCWCRN